jgi:ParB family chromosome partitioning protein
MHRKALGRGLGALIAGVDSTDETGAVLQLSPSMIEPNPFQPRREFAEESLRELADSIKTHGMLQPLVVRENEDGYQLIAGERRLRAAGIAGLSLVPAVVEKADDERMLMVALVENIQREDLGALDEAAAYQELIDRFSLSQAEVARRVGKDRSTVANTIRLLKLPEEIKRLISAGRIAAGHARPILSLSDPADQLALAKQIVEGGLSVREAEKRSRKKGTGAKKGPAEPQPPEIAALEDKLKRHFGTRVQIRSNRGAGSKKGSGRIEIEYYSQDDLGRIIDLLDLNL